MAEHLRDSVTQAEIDLDGEFTLEELEECFEQAQFGKACGNDETRNEMFKCGGATMRQLLLRMFNFLRDIETTPDDWGMGTLVNLYKDGDPAGLGNYRGIALMSYGLWERLWQSGIRGRAWRIIRDAYRGIRMRVLVDGCLTQPVPVSQGVRQGDPLSPVLFLIFIDALAEMLAERCKGLAYSPEGPATRRQLRSLLYADDIVMLAESPEELNAMIEVVRSFCDTWRIEINLAKSQVMEVHPRGVCRKAEGYYYGSKAIEVVKQYKYLGLMLTNTLSWDAHHERALAKARKGHVALARLFARREIPFAAKRAMWTTTTLSSLEYGAERFSIFTQKEKKAVGKGSKVSAAASALHSMALARPTGKPEDVLRGLLVCFAPTLFPKKLRQADRLQRYTNQQGVVRRGPAQVVHRDGSTSTAIWYFRQEDEGEEGNGLDADAADSADKTHISSHTEAQSTSGGRAAKSKKPLLRVLSWNLCFDELAVSARMQEVALVVAEEDPHVIALQEVTPSLWAALSIQPAIQPYLLSGTNGSAILPPMDNPYYTMLLSKLPVLRRERIDYPVSNMGRQLDYAVIQLSDQSPLRAVVGTTHLESLQPNANRRQEQLTFALRTLTSTQVAGMDALLVGDMNMRGRAREELAALGLVNKTKHTNWVDGWLSLSSARGVPRTDSSGATWDLRRNRNRAIVQELLQDAGLVKHTAPKPPGAGATARFDRLYFRSVNLRLKDMRVIGQRLIDTEVGELHASDHWGLGSEKFRGFSFPISPCNLLGSEEHVAGWKGRPHIYDVLTFNSSDNLPATVLP
eukprot:g41555.t1